MSHFKKTLLGAAVSTVVVGFSGMAAADTNLNPAEAKYEQGIYGLIAMQVANRDYDNSPQNDGVQFNNESRLGWRGTAKFDSWDNWTFLWQIESGYVDESFSGEDGGNGYLGRRDTFIGFEHDTIGQVRLGRVLTPIYELIDWPATNPGMGNVWDWGGNIGGNNFNDRQSDSIRWDTNELWKGFTMDIAAGAGQDRAGGTDSTKAGSNYWHGMAAHQQLNGDWGWVQFDLAYEMNYDTKEGDNEKYWDNQTYLLGSQGGFSNGLGYFAYYRIAEAQDTKGSDETEHSYSVGLTYSFGEGNKWQAKIARAENLGLEVDGKDIDGTKDNVTSMQLMYAVDTNAVVYARYAMNDLENTGTTGEGYQGRWKSDSFDEVSVGIEYWF
ncbi:porin [Vibrio aestuarianus]|uniref:Porin n=1 Tax=Vibrio aestuarianus TaxID=28171 RepID=A0ABD7YHX8_9VIBR|nr:porin [Vibrio aestuarianus]WGK84662.1 porin [Vibrio aestuarianus]CAH8216879.1 putative Porin [Vibrio aestuarianus]